MASPIAFFQGSFMPLEEAKIPVMTHAFMYGTAVFEGVRGNWSAAQDELYIFKLREHVTRFRQNAGILRIGIRYSDDELVQIVSDLALRSGYREDIYIRPIAYS